MLSIATLSLREGTTKQTRRCALAVMHGYEVATLSLAMTQFIIFSATKKESPRWAGASETNYKT